MTDTELLDFLADKNQSIANVVLPSECVLRHPESLRDAIKSAICLHKRSLGAKCACDPATWEGSALSDVCEQYQEFHDTGICKRCDHDKACHAPGPNEVKGS